MQLSIGNRNYSSWSLRPWLLLDHFELPFEAMRLAIDAADFAKRIAHYSDAGKVPVMVDGGIAIWDSLAICEYVSEQYLDGRGWPADPLARAQARSASAEMHSSFGVIRSSMPMNCRARRRLDFTPETLAEIARIDRLWCDLRERYDQGGDWLCGDFSSLSATPHEHATGPGVPSGAGLRLPFPLQVAKNGRSRRKGTAGCGSSSPMPPLATPWFGSFSAPSI